MDMNDAADWTWSNFTWSNSSFTGNLGWKIYYNDTSNFTNVTNEMTFEVLQPTCGLTVTAGSPISFGNVDTGAESSEQTVDILNSGNSPTTSFTVYGIDWSGAGHTMIVGQTSVNDTSWHALPLSTSPLTIYSGIISNGETKNPLFRVAIPEGQAQATYSQNITFTGSC
jgi:hypothetical protein